MGVGELLDQIRRYYLTRFEAAIAECAQEPDAYPLTEPEFLDASGTPVCEGVLQTPMRTDIVLLRNGEVEKSLRIETERMLSFSPVEFSWENKIHVSLEPFEWQHCRVRVVPTPDTFEPLVRWFFRWFEPSDPEAPGLLGVVHFLSDPEVRDGQTEVVVDFGSAPVEAVEELLDACIALGASEVTLGSQSAT